MFLHYLGKLKKWLYTINCRTPAAWNSWFHFSKAMAPQQFGPEPRWLQDLGDHAAACVRDADPQCRRTQAVTGWRLEQSAAKCCWRCIQRVEKASAGVCLREGRTFWTPAVGCFDSGMKLSINSPCTMCFEVFNKIIIWHWLKRCYFCVCLFCKVVQKHCLGEVGK